MKEIQFDINKKPKLQYEKVVYLVDKTNVRLMQQYVDKYYHNNKIWENYSCTDWFDDYIVKKIHTNPNDNYVMYFWHKRISGGDIKDEGDYIYGYDIYYIVPQPVMTIE